MAGSVVGEIIIIIVLTLANGLFSASEIAVVSARKGRLAQQAQLGRHGAAVAIELSENPNLFLSTVQVGITLISTFAAAFGGASIAEVAAEALRGVPYLAAHADSIALGCVVLVLSYLSLILGELVPKRLALQNAEGIAIFMAPLMRRVERAVRPVVIFLTFSTELVLRLLGRHAVEETAVTEADIIALVREGAAGGTVEAAEENLIAGVFTFTDRTVRALMTPRTKIVAVAIDTPFTAVLHTITESGYSRIPVYEDSFDQIAGILYVKDLLPVWGRSEEIDLRSFLRPPLYVLEGQRAVVAFQQIKQQRASIAMVLDEYGQVAGLISVEDMLEELVGDIADEYDEVDESFVQRDDGSYLVDGLLPFVDLQARLQLPTGDQVTQEHNFETVAGFLLTLLGRIPSAGDTVSWQGYVFEVVDMDERRIDKILIQPPLDAGEQTRGVMASGAVMPPPNASAAPSTRTQENEERPV